MNHVASALIAIVLAAPVGALHAQDAPPPPRAPDAVPRAAPSPEEMRKTMDATMGAMVPVMGRMTDAAIEAQLRSAERPETAERIAAFKRNLYEALQKKGFTAAQAMQITLATPPPSSSLSSR